MKPSNKVKEAMRMLHGKLEQKMEPSNISLEDFLHEVGRQPRRTLRNIFQLLHNMIHYYVPKGSNEYPNDPNSINYVHYDTSDLFIKDTEVPFFADRLLANRLIHVVDSLKRGVLKNKMLVFIGPPGSGKSTFLNIFLDKLENYCATLEGEMFETVWQVDIRKLGLQPYLPPVDPETNGHPAPDANRMLDNHLVIPCPSHDHPIVHIPKEYRREVLDRIIIDKAFKEELFNHKEYEWVFTKTACPICSSIYKALSEKLSPTETFDMLYVRRYEFSRKLGEGISVYNPGDRLEKLPLENHELQRWIDAIFKSSNAVSYTYSRLAKTNNGIFVIMDVKSNNVSRVKNIHGIISDGIHKVETFEETINSLFIALVNPEDYSVIASQKSFRDRVVTIPVPYIRDYTTEVEIYRNAYSQTLFDAFMPHVLTSFAKIIVSSRLNEKSEYLHEWIRDTSKYAKVCDANLLLLQMEIYSGTFPVWLHEEDIQSMTRTVRRQIIQEGEDQGRKGFSGRQSIDIFNTFLSRHRKKGSLITIEDVHTFFSDPRYLEKLPPDFPDAVRNLYDYTTLQEVKEAMFFYNEQQIGNEIKNYLFALTVDEGQEIESPYTHERIVTGEAYYLETEMRLLKPGTMPEESRKLRNTQLRRFVSATLHQIKSGTPIEETEQFKALLKRYNRNLKEDVMAPFIRNENFRRAIKDFGSEPFKTYDQRIRSEVTLLFRNLETKFGYTRQAAKQICIYVIDNDLANKY